LKQIIEINRLLIEQFGIPSKAEKLPKPIEMLVATILSQNTNDNNSYKAYLNLKSKFKNWEEVRIANRTSIENAIKVAGLGFQKSNAIKNLLNDLNEKFGSYELDLLNTLTEFKGIGVKTASCVLLFSLNKNICPVDTHVHRTLNRIGIVKTKTPDKTFFELNKNFPPKIAHSFHTNLIRLGREICKPTRYSCLNCRLNKICKFENKNLEERVVLKSNTFMLLDNI